MKKLVILGFDGTVADTSPGILYCFNTTATAMGYQPVDHSTMFGIIGIPLEEGFSSLFNMNADEIAYAAKYYSKLYALKGKEMFTLYPGIEEALTELRTNGCKIAIATQKHHMFITDMLKSHRITELFDIVCATDVNTNSTKQALVLQACESLGIAPEDSILIGDSEVDAIGAQGAGIDFAAALYGLGFKSKQEAEKYNCKFCLNNAGELPMKLASI